jgi:hypothetical protein
MRHLLFLILFGFSVASCAAPKVVPAPKPQPAPPIGVTPARPPSSPMVVQPQGPWLDWPVAAGSWIYRRDDRGSIALYGAANADALVTLRCDKGRRTIYLSRAGGAGSTITVRTSSSMKALGAQPTGGKPAYIAAEITTTDPILDAMAYSRGRIAIEASPLLSIAIPVWSEIGRVVEDCRA